MSNHDNTDRGAIWPNKDKKTDKHPDFTGRLNVGGVEYWVSAWRRKEDANPKAPSLVFSIKLKDEADKQGMQQVRDAAPSPDNHGGKSAADYNTQPDWNRADIEDSDIPF